MYANPELIKKHIVKVRLDDQTNRRVDALTEITGDQKAVVTRRLIELGLEALHAEHSPGVRGPEEGADQSATGT